MNRMLFGALVAAIAVGLAGVAIAGSPAQSARSHKQKAGKLKVVHVQASLTVGAHKATGLIGLRCPKGYRAVSGSVSPGATFTLVDAPHPTREGWVGAVENDSDQSANWLLAAVCARGGNRYLKVVRGPNYTAHGKREYARMQRLVREAKR